MVGLPRRPPTHAKRAAPDRRTRIAHRDHARFIAPPGAGSCVSHSRAMRRDDRDDDDRETLVTVRVDPTPVTGEPRTPPKQVDIKPSMRTLQSAGKSLTPGKYPALSAAAPRPKLPSHRSLGASSSGGRSISQSPSRSRRGSAAFPKWWCVHDRVRRDVVAIIDAAHAQHVLFLAILTALFLTDVAAFVSAPDSADLPIGVVMCACLFVIAAEFVANTLCRDG